MAGLPAAIAPATTGERPALIVLPFANLSGDPQQAYFADGIPEDLTTALARIPGFLVIARNTAFTFKGKPVNAQVVGRDLAVRYVLEGSVQKQGERLRLNAQLIDAGDGRHVWAERYDRPLSEIFIVQDEIPDRIAGTVTAQLRRREGERALAAAPGTLEAYDLTMRARLLHFTSEYQGSEEARRLLQEALRRDPNYALAFVHLANVENNFFTNRWNEEYATQAAAERTVAAATRAVTLAPNDALAHAIRGLALRSTRQYKSAEQAAVRAHALAPQDPNVLSLVATTFVGVGRYEEAVEIYRLTRLLDPFVSPQVTGGPLAQALFALERFQESKDAASDCVLRAPTNLLCRESLVRALGELGPPAEARAQANELLRLSPGYTVSEYMRRALVNRRDQAAVSRWADGLRKAGIPE